MAQISDILHAEDVTPLQHLQLFARTVMEGFTTGQHASPHKGFSVEFRHPSDAQIQGLSESFPEEARKLVEANGCKLELTELFRIPAQPFDPACVDLVRQAAKRLGLPSREIISGAGHDAVYVARSVPTAMIFTPCKDGLSHNEAESIMPEEAEAGCQVLFEAVVARANRAI